MKNKKQTQHLSRHPYRQRGCCWYALDGAMLTARPMSDGVPIIATPLGTLDLSVTHDFRKRVSLVLDAVNIKGAAAEQYHSNLHNQRSFLPLNKRYGFQLRFSL